MSIKSKLSSLTLPIKLGAHITGLFWPRDEKLWAFGAHGGEMFMGNSKYLFLELSNSEDYSGIKPVWFCTNEELLNSLKEEGYNAVHPRTIEGILTALRSGTVLYTNAPSDVNGWLTSGSRKVNLWHGMPLKKIGWRATDLNIKPVHKVVFYIIKMRYFLDEDIAFTLSEYFNSIFRSGQYNDQAEIFPDGYPRNDALGRKFPEELIVAEKNDLMEIEESDKTIFTYLPTWGERKENPIEYSRLNTWLKENNSLLIVKPHYFESLQEEKELSNIKFLSPHLDVYPFLRHTDILITDYSSVYFDFLLRDKPIIFFCYDFDHYKEERGFEVDYEFFTAGPKAHSFDKLLDTMEKTLEKDNYSEKRREIRQKTIDNLDFNSCARVLERLT